MSLINRVSKGRLKRPFLMIAYGPDGVGKTSFGASAPKPIFTGGEKGTENLDVNRLSCANLTQFYQDMDSLATEQHDFQSLIVDSIDWLEPVVWQHVCQKNQWTDIEAPGYGKGYVAAVDEWRTITKKLDVLRDKRGMNIILLAHSQVKPFNDPTQLVPYDRYQLKLHEKSAALLREWVDMVLFINYEVFVKTESKNAKKGKGLGEGDRLIFTTRMPGYDAKNRFGLPQEVPLAYPNGFEAFTKLIYAEKSPAEMRAEIDRLVPQVKDEAVKKKVLDALPSVSDADLGAYVRRLTEIVNAQSL